MKNLYSILILLSFSILSQGQVFLQEDFSANQMPPEGWTIDAYANRWSVQPTAHAQGTAPEARFSYWPEEGTSRLISPFVDLTGRDVVTLIFKHMLHDYAGNGYTIGVATRAGDGDWHDVLSISPTGHIPAEEMTIDIANEDVGEPDFQFCYFVSGDFYKLNYWYIDDIWLIFSLDLDAGIQTVTTPNFITSPSEVEGTIKNFGETEITEMEISWQLDDGEITTTLFEGLSIEFNEEYDFTCEGIIDVPANTYLLSVRIETVNGVIDQDTINNLNEKIINVASHTVQHRPCLEEFTSSTCMPCASFNESFVPWCDEHADEITLVKYQMNWPGYGDPYYTIEGGIRRSWYGVNMVPWTNFDGYFTNSSMGTIQTMFNTSIAEPGLVKVLGAFTLNGTVMDIDVTVLPFVYIPAALIHVVVFEYETYENAASNGETEFHHVMMKMVPDAYGSVTILQDRLPFVISESVDLAGTNVEEWDDLGVAIIVQDTVSRYIYQSDYAIEDAVFGTDATLSDLLVDGETIQGFSPDVFNYTVELPTGSTNIPVVEATTTDPNALSIIVPTNVLPGITTVDVYAEDISIHNTYTVMFDNAVSLRDPLQNTVNIYPNPTSGQLYISGVDNARVTIYNVSGAVVASYEGMHSGRVNLDHLENGIYIMSIVGENQSVLNRKISIIK